MLFDQITPFVRFTAEQNMSNSWVNDGKEIVGYDHRIYYVLQGRGSIQIGQENYDLQPDTFIMWHAGIPYRYLSEKLNAMICITCNFDFTSQASQYRTPIAPSRPKEFDPAEILEKDVFFSDHKPFNKTVFLPNSPNIRALMIKLKEAYTKKQKFYSLRCNNILQEILIKVAYQTDDVLSRNNELVSSILDYIHEHFRDNPTNEEIGAKFGYHPNYINTLLVKHTKMSLHRYVIDCKLTYAVQQLLTSDKSIAEIAEEINIPDTQYFARLFKKHFQKTPSQFRLKK
ncbi:MAG: helix-turn-helix domain-containing protein [Clostridia bacterium]|nr:helix-turn-helix domain-containing protein [Clostridia bacterium]